MEDDNNFENLIEKLEAELPQLVTPNHLVNLGLASHVMLFRIRQNAEIPFIKLSSARILYLKSDVIDWLKKSYIHPKESLCCKKTNEIGRESEGDYHKRKQS